ncbi:RIP metalloprotease RseP [Novosphingobium umbonatum]|uniref:RIP metalloprotease RseP n=1 Tax=Novosphingobium umbonatum TaxID=1908524 RepID=UPI001FE75B0B|nr:RIP metalloprotease RseP [Novosphingobium umbonatum]
MEHPSILMTVLAFGLLLGPLVTLHELGHYLVGRWCGVKAVAFSIGFGRELAGWTDSRGTRWKLSMLPLGGYVQFAGDMNPASVGVDKIPLDLKEREGWFHFKPLWQRFLIVFAGPGTNLLVAVAIFAAFNLAYGRIYAPPVVAGFATQSVAKDAGVREGDRIVAIGDKEITGFEQVRDQIAPYPDEMVTIVVERDGLRHSYPVKIASKTVTDEFGNESRIGMLGIAGQGLKRERLGVGRSLTYAVEQTYGVMGTMVSGLRQIFTGQRSVRELGGPVKIAKFSGERLALGWQEFVYFSAFISINLAFINLLPIPGLDGGHLAFYLAEGVRRKPLGARSQEWALRTGLAFVLALMVFVTINDLVPANLFGS